MDVDLIRRQFTVEEYVRMINTQILGQTEHVELIEGDILEMAPIGPSHATCVAMLTRRLVIGIGDRGLVVPQMTRPLDSRSAPEPDLTVLRPRERSCREARAPASRKSGSWMSRPIVSSYFGIREAVPMSRRMRSVATAWSCRWRFPISGCSSTKSSGSLHRGMAQ